MSQSLGKNTTLKPLQRRATEIPLTKGYQRNPENGRVLRNRSKRELDTLLNRDSSAQGRKGYSGEHLDKDNLSNSLNAKSIGSNVDIGNWGL